MIVRLLRGRDPLWLGAKGKNLNQLRTFVVVHRFPLVESLQPPLGGASTAKRLIRMKKQDCRHFESQNLEDQLGLVAGSRLNRDSGYARTLPESCVAIDSIVHVKNKLCGGTRDAFAMRHVVERPLQLGMRVHVSMDVLQALAGGPEALLEFRLGLNLS